MNQNPSKWEYRGKSLLIALIPAIGLPFLLSFFSDKYISMIGYYAYMVSLLPGMAFSILVELFIPVYLLDNHSFWEMVEGIIGQVFFWYVCVQFIRKSVTKSKLSSTQEINPDRRKSVLRSTILIISLDLIFYSISPIIGWVIYKNNLNGPETVDVLGNFFSFMPFSTIILITEQYWIYVIAIANASILVFASWTAHTYKKNWLSIIPIFFILITLAEVALSFAIWVVGKGNLFFFPIHLVTSAIMVVVHATYISYVRS